MRLLVVEDEPKVAAAVASALRQEGYAVDVAPNGDAALDFSTAYRYDLVILDRILPGMTGLDVARELRRRRSVNAAVPLLVLTALGTVDDRVTGLDSGADDYLVKPFAMRELLARVRALVRRETSAAPVLSVSGLEIDPAAHRVTRGGKAVELTAREFALLEVLARNAGRVLSQQYLLDAVWDAAFDPESNVVEVHVSSLRRKLGGRRNSLIRTVRGAGYKIDAPVR